MTEINGVIIKGVGGKYVVDTPEGKFTCNARGLFRKKKITPIVGDRVKINNSTLVEIMPRINELQRPKVSNVDIVLIVMAAAMPDLHFTMLDRYLMQAEYREIEAAICVNKTELNEYMAEEVKAIYEPVGYNVFIVSVSEQVGLSDLEAFLHKKTTVLAGPSGVGKSSIINALTKRNLEIGIVSERIGRGRHTTRHTELMPFGQSGYVIDTPGFSSLDVPNIPKAERAYLFKEFRPFLGQCGFRDCLHWSEKDCAVKEQVGMSIDPRRYNRYLEWIGE